MNPTASLRHELCSELGKLLLPLLLPLMQQSSNTHGSLRIKYINVGVSFDVTTLVKCGVFHNTKHLSTLHFISSKGSMCCTRFRPALIPTAHRLCFNVPKKVLGFSERAINHYTIRKRFLRSDLRSTWH